MKEIFNISEDIYDYLNKMPLEIDDIKELIEYVHYKSLIDSFNYIIENNQENKDMDFLLIDYVEILTKFQLVFNNISTKYKKNKNESE